MEFEMDELYLTIINNLNDGVYFVDLDRRILFWNKAAERITGYSADEIMGRQCQDNILNHIDEDGRPLCVIGCPLFATIIDGKQRQARVFVRHKDGYRIPILVNISPMKKNGEIVGAIEIFTQNSPTVYEDNLVEHLSGIAMHDALTQLPNRRYLESFLNYKLNEYKRFGRLFAVLFADIDDFSHFNNEYGHDTGDRVLVNIASSIKKNMNRNDLIGQWGGEEFVGIYSVVNDYDAPIIAEKFRQMVLNTEVAHEDTALHISVSVGIALIRNDDTPASILERADHCMYQGKKAGKNRVTSD